MKEKFRITYYKNNQSKVILTTIIMAKNLNSAKRIAEKLEPFEWDELEITNLTSRWYQQLDAIKFGI